MCIYCGNIYKNHLSNPPKASDLLNASVLGTNQDLANYLTSGFWNDSSTEARKFNLTNTGVNAKNGLLTYNTTGNNYDSDGISYARSLLVDESFKLLENTLGIDFQKTTTSNADIRFSDSFPGAYAYSNYSSGNINYSNINISDSWNVYRSGFGNYTFQTILHEIGHALGLGHQGFYNGSGSYLNDANFTNDSWQSSIMSYFSQSENTSINASFAYLSNFSVVDLIALDDIYSPQGFSLNNAFVGDTTYGFNTNITFSTSQIFSELTNWIDSTAFAIADGNGNDTFDFSGFSNNQSIDLRATNKNSNSLFSSNIAGLTGNLVISAGTIIENAIGGSGNDTITGNSSNNILNGGNGNDLLIGGLGDDTYFVDSISDSVHENFNEGTDLIITSVSYTLPSNIEKIILTGSLDIDAYGNGLNNTLKGNAGKNLLDGKLGTDIVIFDGFFNDYSLSVSNGNLVIEDNRSNSPNGISIIKNIEIAEFSDLNKTINELLNIFYTIRENNYLADDLKILDESTNVIINASAITSLAGNAADLINVYASSGISGLGNEAVTISNTSVDGSLLNILDGNTTGIINASSVSTLEGNTSALVNIYASTEISGLGNEAITISDGFIDASLLNILDGNTTGLINASSVLTLKGNTSALINTYSSTEIIGLGNEAVTVNSGEISVSSANILSEASTGKVTATISDGDMAKLLSLNGNNNAYTITISDASAEASKLIELYEKTTAKINASKLRTINGNSSDLNTVYSLSGIIGLGNETINISDTSIDAFLLNILDGNTTGKINASTVTKLTGSESEINSAISSNGISDGESAVPLWLSYFESLEYLASNQDLINTFGLNSNNAKLHYINYGRAEGRKLSTFNSSQYLKNYSDLKEAFGGSETLALEHYIQYGNKEGRNDHFNNISESENSTISLNDFQALNYIASHIDLISAFSTNLEAANNLESAKSHYNDYGIAEGRTLDDFDEWSYLASNNDLIIAFGKDTYKAIKHYISYGKSEGRTTNIFNANSYLNNYTDLKNAFGNDHKLATKHYVEFGFNEGRLF